MKIYLNLHAASSVRAAGVQQSIRTCYYLAAAGARVELHLCSRFFSERSELLRFFGFEDLPNLGIRFYADPTSPHHSFHVFSKPTGGLDGLVRLLTVTWGALFHLRRIITLMFRRRKEPGDAVFLRGHRFPALYVFLKRPLALTTLYEIHEVSYLADLEDSEILQKRVACDFERFSYRRADAVVFISGTLEDLVRKKWGAAENAVVLPSGTKQVVSEPLPVEVRLTRIYFVGNYYDFSGLDRVVRALEEIDDVTLTVVGGGDVGDTDRDRVASLAGKLGVTDRVEFLGFVAPSELRGVYADAHILVMPHAGHIRSRYFVSPLKLFEYLSARRPIVASDLAPIREILEDGRNAVLVKADDTEALVDGIRRVTENREFAHEIAEAAYEASRAYSLEERGKALRAHLESTVRKKSVVSPAGG